MGIRRGLVVVSNRLPVSRSGGRWVSGAGGLVTALVPIIREKRGEWVGWTGSAGPAPRRFEHDGIRLRGVGISASELASFYHGFSNRTLWPLFHDAIRSPEFNPQWWEPYVEVNRRFARAAARASARGGIVWVHDYHLMLVPAMIREERPDLRIGFFLHIPFPPDELFSWLPRRVELIRGLLGADVVGFQTHSDAQNFARLARKFADAEGAADALEYDGRSVHVREFPISIDFDWFDERARTDATKKAAAEIRKRIGTSRKILLAVDRLDYTKGIAERLDAFERMLQHRQLSVHDCVLIQIAAPSREQVKEYAEMRTHIDRIVGSINGEFSVPGRVAVHYFRRTYSLEEVVPFYLAADVMLVTPLRDGMNLVAKEYVASRANTDGALVLSEFAGAASQMRQAFLVNPRDIEGTSDAIGRAMTMRRAEARFRMAYLRSAIRRHNVYDWADEFLEVLAA